ncbi:MAG: FG-GAP-like repeat-containing protein, partial [Endomicrobiales bacterium]
TASKGHAKITCEGSNCLLMDIGSTGGVAVNGEKVGQLNEVSILNGVEIAIGRTIFRFVDSGSDDYSLPRKHGIFLLKIRQPVSFIFTLTVLALGLGLLYQGLLGVSIISGKPKKVDVDINRYWSPEENAVRASQQEYDITSSPAIGDINNDGRNEVVYINSSGFLCAWDGKKGAEVWKPVEIYNSGKSSPVLYDMNNDGFLDIIVVSDTSMLYVIDGQAGGIIRREMLGGGISELSPAVCDLNGDLQPDIVVCSEEGMVHFVYSPGFEGGMEKFTEFVEGPLYASPVVVSTKKISPMVVVCSNNSKVYFFDGSDRSKKTIDLVEKTGKAHLIAATPAVGDLDGDGMPEVVVQSNVPQYMSAINITRFEVNWTYFVEPIPPTGLKHTASPVVTDVNNDGLGDVVALSANGGVYALRGKTGYPSGELLWKMDMPEPNRMLSSPALYDFDKNGLMDIVFGSEDGSIYVLKNTPTRKEMEIMTTVKASNVPITSAVVIGDVTGDSSLDIVYSSSLNAVQMLTTNARTFKNKVIWPMYLGNPKKTGAILNKENIQPYLLMSAGGAALFILLMILKLTLKMKKISKRPRVVYV